jgi:hypothetical protein
MSCNLIAPIPGARCWGVSDILNRAPHSPSSADFAAIPPKADGISAKKSKEYGTLPAIGQGSRTEHADPVQHDDNFVHAVQEHLRAGS